MACLDNICTLGICPDEATPTSGFSLIKAAGISLNTLSDIANETYTQGTTLAMEKKSLAITKLKNDFIGALQANNVVTQISIPTYNSGVFNYDKNMGANAMGRGLRLHKTPYRGTLRKTSINSVSCYPYQSGTGTLQIILERNGFKTTYSWAINLTGGQVNTFTEDAISEFPFSLPMDSSSCDILIVSDVEFCSSVITCMKGCNGSMPNPCAWVEGWTGSNVIKDEGYGISVNFQCECDYEKILCDLSKSFSGELIFLKWQIEIFEEAARTNRFNNWVTYGKEDINDVILPDLKSQYNRKWTDLMNGALGILQQYRDECLNCRGVRWKTNI